jgi:5-(carboxyamino)imidazole ribonucleotide mutase
MSNAAAFTTEGTDTQVRLARQILARASAVPFHHIRCARIRALMTRLVKKPLVGIVMGSQSDWGVMQHAVQQLDDFGIPYEARIVSAHRTPDLLYEYAEAAAARGLRCIIAGAGGSAHLPGMLAAKTIVPVLGVPVPTRHLKGLDSLLSIVQMPKGVPVATFAVGETGAVNAALFAVALLARDDERLARRVQAFRNKQTRAVRAMKLPA